MKLGFDPFVLFICKVTLLSRFLLNEGIEREAFQVCFQTVGPNKYSNHSLNTWDNKIFTVFNNPPYTAFGV